MNINGICMEFETYKFKHYRNQSLQSISLRLFLKKLIIKSSQANVKICAYISVCTIHVALLFGKLVMYLSHGNFMTIHMFLKQQVHIFNHIATFSDMNFVEGAELAFGQK